MKKILLSALMIISSALMALDYDSFGLPYKVADCYKPGHDQRMMGIEDKDVRTKMIMACHEYIKEQLVKHMGSYDEYASFCKEYTDAGFTIPNCSKDDLQLAKTAFEKQMGASEVLSYVTGSPQVESLKDRCAQEKTPTAKEACYNGVGLGESAVPCEARCDSLMVKDQAARDAVSARPADADASSVDRQ